MSSFVFDWNQPMTAKLRPVLFVWTDDEVMKPVDKMLPLCVRQFTIGAEYPLEVVQPRSMASHGHYFAALNEAFLNLNEDDAKRFKTVEHLRAWALVKTGFCKETDYPFGSPQEAAFVAKIIRARSSYAVIVVSGDVVKVFDPESQAVYGPDAMPAERFQESKTAVLDLVATMARTTAAELNKQADRVAKRERPAKESKPSEPAQPIMAPEGPVSSKITSEIDATVRAEPQTAPDYFARARLWIMSSKTADDAWARWDGEREMRDALRVSIQNRNELSKLIEARFQKKEAAR
jgi:hypothetical protein